MKKNLIFIALLICSICIAEDAEVVFSDGKRISGNIRMTEGRKLRLITKSEKKSIKLKDVNRIDVIPEKNEMKQKWRFPESGKAIKEKWGKPYPIQYYKTSITLNSGEKFKGHLFTTVLYLKTKQKSDEIKIILKSKQRGEQGKQISSLIYPKQIVVTGKENAKPSSRSEITVVKRYHNTPYEIAVLTRPELNRVKLQRKPLTHSYTFKNISSEFFSALRTDAAISVQWNGTDDKKLKKLVEKNLKYIKDFFDQKKLVSVMLNEDNERVFSLVMMNRNRKTTLKKDKSNPWRLMIFRWKYDEDEEKLLLADKGYLFRGIIGKSENPPDVKTREKLCKIHHEFRK